MGLFGKMVEKTPVPEAIDPGLPERVPVRECVPVRALAIPLAEAHYGRQAADYRGEKAAAPQAPEGGSTGKI